MSLPPVRRLRTLRRAVAAVPVAVVIAAAVLPAAPSALALPASTGWAQWTGPAGGSHAFTGTMQLPPQDFPAAAWTSDSRSPVQLPSGASTYLGSTAPPGAQYGSSQGSAYLNLRPYADNGTSPSTTTFDFAAPTPSAGWTFVLGDVDADQVHIAARDAAGQAVPDSDIARWERGAFNYAGGTDTPTWHAGTATLIGNAAAADTSGASDWFEPDRALSSLTFVYTQRAGFPVYQVWFAARAHDVTGAVTGTTQCPATATTVRLFAPNGDALASTHPGSDGSYSFTGYAAQPGYTVSVDAPTTPADACEVVGAGRRSVDLTAGDATADFTVQDVVPQPVGGTVTTTDGTPVAGAVITLTPPVGPARTAVTDDNGRYVFGANPIAAGYHIGVTAPAGYDTQPPTTRTFEIVNGRPVPDQDFVLVERPAVSGTVTGPDGPLAAVPVTLVDDNGNRLHTVTDAGGRYRFDRVPAGRYGIAVTAPDGYAPAQDREGVVVASTDVPDQDFALTRVGGVAGTVTDNGQPVADVAVSVTGPTGTQHLHTGADGTYSATGLVPATYTVVVHPPAGYTIHGSASRSATITAAGELRGGLDFTLARAASSTPSTRSTPGATTPTTGSGNSVTGSSTSLAATGVPVAGLLLAALALLAAGAATAACSRRDAARGTRR